MKTWKVPGAALAAVFCVSLVLAALGEELVDRIVAVIDEDPIFASDIERVLALRFVEPRPGEDAAALRRRVLDQLIDQRLQLHEVQLHGAGQVSVEEIENQMKAIRSHFETTGGWDAHLRSIGLDEEGLRHVLTRQLRVMAYIEERLRPRVFVDLDDVRAYYDGELTAEMERANHEKPAFEDVREPIRALLLERGLNREIEVWTEELHRKAEIVDYFDVPPRPLPPVVGRLSADG